MAFAFGLIVHSPYKPDLFRSLCRGQQATLPATCRAQASFLHPAQDTTSIASSPIPEIPEQRSTFDVLRIVKTCKLPLRLSDLSNDLNGSWTRLGGLNDWNVWNRR